MCGLYMDWCTLQARYREGSLAAGLWQPQQIFVGPQEAKTLPIEGHLSDIPWVATNVGTQESLLGTLEPSSYPLL